MSLLIAKNCNFENFILILKLEILSLDIHFILRLSAKHFKFLFVSHEFLERDFLVPFILFDNFQFPPLFINNLR